jgi:hypothetical protein
MVPEDHSSQVFRAFQFFPCPDCTRVYVLLMAADDYSAQKSLELLSAADQLYEAVCDLLAAVAEPDDVSLAAAMHKAERAQAAACGGVLARDRVRRP